MWLRCRGHVERDEDGQPVLFAGIITNLGRKNKIDYLSGQFNKYELEDALQMMVSKEEHFYMMILDLDEFSSVNKLYNHQFGDAVLAKQHSSFSRFFPSRQGCIAMMGMSLSYCFGTVWIPGIFPNAISGCKRSWIISAF